MENIKLIIPVLPNLMVRYLLSRIVFVLFLLLIATEAKQRVHDMKIARLSKKNADSLKSCYLESGKKRRECFSVSIKGRNPNITNKKYHFFDSKSGKDVILSGELEETGFIFIRRNEAQIPFGRGRCINTFLSFDYDNEWVFLSQDNETGFLYCEVSKDNYFSIYPENITLGRVFQELKFIKSF